MGHRNFRRSYTNPQHLIYPLPLEFPEDLYPCESQYLQEYTARCELGRKRIKKLKVGILSTARDIGSTFHRTQYYFTQVGELFNDYEIFIYESDSVDNTAWLLQNWSRGNRRVKFWSERLNLPRLGDLSQRRFEVMATIRNRYLDYANQYMGDLDYLCVLDADLRYGISSEGVLNSFGYTELWDIIAANGIDYGEQYYYDLAVLMLNGFAPEDVMVEMKPRAKYANIKRGFERPRFNRGESLYKVASAFGGMAFYRTDALLSAKYETFLCDHASLHTRLFQNGYRRLFINPSMILIR